MQVFKACLKVIKINMPMLLTYILVFVGVTIVINLLNQPADMQGFTESKCRVAIINNDEESVIVQGLMDFVGERNIMVSIGGDRESIQDALFFQQADYIIIIPEGFTGSLMETGYARLEKTAIPGSISSLLVDMNVEKYLQTAGLYIKHQPGITQEGLVEEIHRNLSEEVSVTMRDHRKVEDMKSHSYFFNYAFYTNSIMLILGVSSILLALNRPDMRQRTLCSPIKPRRISFEIMLGNLMLALFLWLINLLLAFIICGSDIISISGLLWAANLLLITIVMLSISILLGGFIKKKNTQSAVANTLALGMSFVSGAFVPQALLGKSVLAAAKFLPSYWYVKASDEIGRLKEISRSSLEPVFICFLIELGFAMAIICVILAVNRQRRLDTAL